MGTTLALCNLSPNDVQQEQGCTNSKGFVMVVARCERWCPIL